MACQVGQEPTRNKIGKSGTRKSAEQLCGQPYENGHSLWETSVSTSEDALTHQVKRNTGSDNVSWPLSSAIPLPAQ